MVTIFAYVVEKQYCLFFRKNFLSFKKDLSCASPANQRDGVISSVAMLESSTDTLIKSGKINVKKIKDNKQLNIDTIKLLKNSEFKLEKFNFNGCIGTQNAAFTAMIVSFINIITSILVSNNKNKKINYFLKIDPIYQNQNIVNLQFNCIISLKIVNIINIIYILKKKGRVDKNERTSNRRSYAYSYE